VVAPVTGFEIDLDDDELARVVRRAHLPPLLAALAHATGDLSILRPDLRCDATRVRESQGGLTPEQREAARALAVDVLRRLRDRPAPERELADNDPDLLRQRMDFVIGERVADDYVHLLLEELALSGEDLRAPDWHRNALDPDRAFLVVIVGAGMSGIAAAHRLRQAGVDVVILEKNDDVGGTWFENRYPGCRVDVPNHLYSYSFAQRDDWPQQFSPQAVLQQYFRAVADDVGVTPHIRFGTEVLHARWRADETWELSVRNERGETETLVANVLVSAVGQLNRPKLPDIPGRDSFAGPAFHSAEWDHDVDLKGKRVAVIGTGASAIQIVPAIADEVEELLVFQRTPNWMMPTPQYYAPMPDEMSWLMAHVPFYAQWYRFWLFWRLAEGALPAARVDPAWAVARDGGGSVSALNDELRAALTQDIELQFAETPDLLPHVIPNYPPLAKRILLDNGIWASTLTREHVSLVSDGIERVTPTGIVTADGREHAVDVIAYATGFHASRFLTPMRVTGRDGADLHEHWRDEPYAYLGLTVTGFPNLFCLYGPNTNLVANGSIIFFSECGVRYVVESVRRLLERRARSLELKADVYEAEHARVDAANAQMAWGVSSVNSWYKNAQGRVTQNWPFTLLEYWDRTRGPDLAEYDVR
jgi:4-hydroxyacetophenone monooxygenase